MRPTAVAIGTPSPNYRLSHQEDVPHQPHLRGTIAPTALSYYHAGNIHIVKICLITIG